jgi:hypothetical protein
MRMAVEEETLAQRFQWHPPKAAHNLKAHQVSFTEATTVFDDSLHEVFPDPDHSAFEDRLIALGTSNKGRLLFVSSVERGDATRIISARKATRQELHEYEEED